VFRESIRGPTDEIDADNASAMPHQLSHTCTSRTTSYVLRTTFWGLSSLTAGLFITPRSFPKNRFVLWQAGCWAVSRWARYSLRGRWRL